jgi:hypothetical protein
MTQQLPILELQYVDFTGSKGTVTMRAPLGTTYAEMDASAITLASIIAPVTGCTLIRQRIIFKSVVVPKPATDDSSPIVRSGAFFFASSDDDNQALAIVPGLLEDLYVTTEPGAGVLIDIENADVVAFIATALDVPITDPFGVAMDHIVAAYRQSRT